MRDAQVLGDLQLIIDRYPQKRSALLPMLHLLQSVEGRVTPEAIELCAELLDLSTADVNGVATFYTMYKRREVGDYHVGVCTNTLCAVMGGDAIFERLREHLGVGNDERTADGTVTLEHIECNAACDYAPVMTVNWEFMDNQTPDSAVQLVEDLRAGRPCRSTRGATITSWREAERVLAGFPDGRVDEGPSAGEPSLAGLRIAHERGWTAPGDEDDSAGRGASAASDRDPADSAGRGASAASDRDPADPAGRGASAASDRDLDSAVDEADTARAESETQVDDAPTPPAEREEAE
nr:NADH-quinone oxidoreductase subunit NuoE [Mumia flava]